MIATLQLDQLPISRNIAIYGKIFAIAHGKPFMSMMLRHDLQEFRQGFTSLMLVRDGEMNIKINGKNYHLKKNDLLVCPINTIYEKNVFTNDTRIMFVGFLQEELFPDHASYSLTYVWEKNMGPVLLKVDENRMHLIMDIFNLCRRVFYITDSYELRKEMIIGCLKVILAGVAEWFLKTSSEKSSVNTNHDEALMAHFVHNIRLHCQRERSVAFYARKLNMSPKYFSSVIQKISGESPTYWIKNQVIGEAKRMLKSRYYNVQQISDKLNFPNSSFFCRYFKGFVGISPRQYMLNKDME